MLLDLMRGLAAVLVLWQHLHDVYLVDYNQAAPLSSHPHWLWPLYLTISAGNQAVVIFFVLSGYLVGGSVFRWFSNDTWSWGRYLTHRLVRLWVVLLPALVMCVFWDGLRKLRTEGLHSLWMAWTLRAPADRLSLGLFLSNSFFLQSVKTPTFGSDRPLWSLASEFWYYLLFPLLYLAIRRQSRSLLRLGAAAGFVIVALFMGRATVALFPLWIIGVLLTKMPIVRFGRAVRWITAIVYVPFVLFLDTNPSPSRLFTQGYVCAAATFLLVWVLLSARSAADERSPLFWLSKRLAGCSYTLYLVHFPLLAFIATFLISGPHWQPGMQHLLALAGLSCLIVLYAHAIASLTEAHNEAVRSWVERRLGIVGFKRQ